MPIMMISNIVIATVLFVTRIIIDGKKKSSSDIVTMIMTNQQALCYIVLSRPLSLQFMRNPPAIVPSLCSEHLRQGSVIQVIPLARLACSTIPSCSTFLLMVLCGGES